MSVATERRLVWRRRLLLAGLVPLLLALAFAVKVGLMLGLDDRGRTSFTDGRFDSAREAFALNARLNLLEPWVSVFDEGTSEYRLADYATAQALLEDALLVVPSEQECLVRINLALTLEALGDADLADGQPDQAAASWREGLGVLDEGACRDLPDGLTVADRLASKLADREPDPDVVEPPPDEPDDPLTQEEELEQRNEEAQEQRRKNDEVREDQPPAPGTPPSYSW